MDKDEIEKYIGELKKKKCSQIESIKLLMDKFDLSLSDADFYLLNSSTWKELKGETEELRNLFDDELSSSE